MNKQKFTHIIEGKSIHKEYVSGSQTIPVLNDIDFNVKKGEFISIMGPSGCGKSTLLYILGGLDAPTDGRVLFQGENFTDMSDKDRGYIRRNKIGFIFQFYNLIHNLTVKENIILPIVMEGERASSYNSKFNDIIQFVGLADRVDFTPRELSGGQQQRVAIARALMKEPDLILADEPIGNLDSKGGTQIMELFKDINKKKGTTIIQVTHSNFAAEYGTRIINMRDGQIAE